MPHHFILTVLYVSSVLSSITIRRTGWLDRVVQYYKNRFYDEVKKEPLVKIKARIERPPPGYTDSTLWDYKAVLRLLTLIRKSEDTVDVKRAIKRTMQGSRRFMALKENLKVFPSLSKNQVSDFYYSFGSGEYYADITHEAFRPLSDNDVILVSNPVEARLPSARISVQLLKSILENRAEAGRYMTSTTSTFSWLPINTSNDNSTQGLSNETNAGGTGGGATGGTTSGEVATTAAPAA